MFELFEEFIEILANWAILAFEFVGIVVLVVAGIKGIKDYFTKNPSIRLNLAEGMALALEFKLGSEILRTVIVRDVRELYFTAMLVLLRAALTYLIHWEIDYEVKSKKREELNNIGLEQIELGDRDDVVDKLLDTRFGRQNEKLKTEANKTSPSEKPTKTNKD